MDLLNSHLLSFLIWFPVLGGLVVLLTGNDRHAATTRWIALATGLITFFVSVPLCPLSARRPGYAVRREDGLDQSIPYRVFPGSGWHFYAACTVDYTPDRCGYRCGLGGHQSPRCPVFRCLSYHGRFDDRRVLRAGRSPFLSVLGSHADPHVPDHWRVGRG